MNQRHRDQEGVFAPDHVAEPAENQRAERANGKARREGEQREDEADGWRDVGEEELRQERSERSVDVKVVPLEDCPEGGRENDFSFLSRHSAGRADRARRCSYGHP
jgi:hypothetical protein